MGKILFSMVFLCQLSLAIEDELPAQETEPLYSASPQAQTDAEQEPEQEIFDEGSDLIAAEMTETNEVEEETSARFIPTEEISQDLGVSFPVDI